MERITSKRPWDEAKEDLRNEMGYSHIWTRLNAIEDILGDDYDLDQLSVLVNQRMTMRENVAVRMKLVGGIPLDRLRELVEAWKDGPCALCMYRPPSSTDGKPCTMCPASRGEN